MKSQNATNRYFYSHREKKIWNKLRARKGKTLKIERIEIKMMKMFNSA